MRGTYRPVLQEDRPVPTDGSRVSEPGSQFARQDLKAQKLIAGAVRDLEAAMSKLRKAEELSPSADPVSDVIPVLRKQRNHLSKIENALGY